MSANIYCRPISTARRDIPIGTPSLFITVIEETFGTFPITIGTTSDRLILRGMIAGATDRDWKKCFEILYQEIEKHGEIEIFAEY